MIILLRCRKIKNKKMGWLPFAAYGVAAAYSIAYYLDLPFWKIVSKDMTATLCLLFALIIESCIQSGLIPSNTGYAQLFAASTISAQITARMENAFISLRVLNILYQRSQNR